jgi:hypothetical protein
MDTTVPENDVQDQGNHRNIETQAHECDGEFTARCILGIAVGAGQNRALYAQLPRSLEYLCRTMRHTDTSTSSQALIRIAELQCFCVT